MRVRREEIGRDGVQRGQERGLSVQGGADRGQRRGQVQSAVAVRAQRVQPQLQGHHRRGVPDAEHGDRRQGDQGADLGHGRARALPRRHVRVLPRRRRGAHRVRHQPQGHVRECGPLAGRAARYARAVRGLDAFHGLALFVAVALVGWHCALALVMWHASALEWWRAGERGCWTWGVRVEGV